jgi:hypothetical protein
MALALPQGANAQPAKANVVVVNDSDWDVIHLYFSVAGSNQWGSDLLRNDPLQPGENLSLANLDCHTYDVRVVSTDGKDCVIRNTEVCTSSKVWHFTNKDLAKCEGVPGN